MADELAAYPTLRRRLESLGATGARLPLDEAVAVARQVALAMDDARRQGTPCPTIMPERIALAPEPSGGLPYRPLLAPADGGTQPEGNLAYAAPEQAIGDPADARSDVYSLGILLYELVTGQRPFPVRTLAEAIRFHSKEPPPAPRSLRPDLPEALEQVILKALQKDPAARFADGAALAGALEAAMAAVPAAEAAPAAAEAPLEPLGEPTGDTITAIAPDGSVRSYPCRQGAMRIGRSASNDVVLDYSGVEPQHARLHVAAGSCRVESISAAGETFLGAERLMPGTVTPWAPDRMLRIGSVRLHLEAVSRPAPQPEPLPPPPPVEPPAIPVAEPPRPPQPRWGLWLAIAAGVVLVGAVAAVAIALRPAAGPGPVAIAPTPEPTPGPTLEPTPWPSLAPTTPAPATAEPTVPPTKEPTIEPTATPSLTPTPCAAAGARFAAAYGPRQAQLGCPKGAPVETWMAVERFEHGLMFWSQDNETIYALVQTASGTIWDQAADTWAEGQPDSDPALVPPAGRVQPVRGFGKFWRERLGGPGSKIGWATQPEQGFDGGRQSFANGLLIAGPGGEVYALLADGHWEGPY
ncbi:MAG TPA: protein kinase [Anaerolineae bacterium]|nr:protein kinase [Anaerolineae bacterium]HOQ99422.1 protein kinase [Anaerolineae bacterium]HPL28967.1 protein kinase [Anaerolineae bacterium]